jgi:ribose transport system ATP-binding protein
MCGAATTNEPLLKAEGLSKAFSGVRVLNRIDLTLHRGRILGLIGENGAGKSTLCKILNGVHTPTAGTLTFAGQPIPHMTAARARRLGIATIPQEFNLISTLSVRENIFLGREIRRAGLFLDAAAMRRKAAALLEGLGSTIQPDDRIQELNVAGKQLVEIAKAIVDHCRLLIMDEPTTVLTPDEVDVLFALMRRLRDNGTAIIYVSHKLREVKSICDEVMVLRDGEFISRTPAADLTEHEMALRMVGREMNQLFPDKRTPGRETVMEVRNLSVAGLVKDVGFVLRQGEILGFAGLMGAGRTEMAEAIMGIRKPLRGTVLLDGSPITIRCPRDAVTHGLAYLPEDRQGAGILTALSVVNNTTLISLAQYGRVLTRRREERAAAARYREAFNIKTDSLDTPLEFLSGGNQQKVALAKGLDPKPGIFIFDEPTRGIDVNAKGEIYAFIQGLLRDGIACLLISSDLEEIIGLSHRVAVMREGQLVGLLEGADINEERIMLLATGVAGPSPAGPAQGHPRRESGT